MSNDYKNDFTIWDKEDLSCGPTGLQIKSDYYDERQKMDKNIGNHVVVIKNDKMGFGADDLGAILIKGFLNTIKKISDLPQKIIFYNSGVKLILKDSPVIDSLQELEELGVTILICGTCADYFKVKDKVGCGTLSNMYDITDSLTHASHIIVP